MSSDDEKDDDLFKVKVKTATEKVILHLCITTWNY